MPGAGPPRRHPRDFGSPRYIRRISCGEGRIEYEAIVELLDYAGGHEQLVRIITTDDQEVVGVPTSVDTHPTALEVYLRPLGADHTEIAVRLTQIRAVEMG